MLVYISPMSGYTDYAYRQIMKKFKPDLMYTEMVNSNLLIKDNYNTLNSIMKMSDDEITGIQLFGSNIEDLYHNFIKLDKLKYSNLLLNMGCPQPKILKNGSGANMLCRYTEVRELLSSLNDKGIKVSIKVRDSENTLKYFELANELNLPFFCIHTRTKEQGFSGFANHNITKELSLLERRIKLIANGDIFSLDDFNKIKDYNIDGVMLARGIVSNPFLIEEIKTGKKISRTTDDVKKIVLEHMDLLKEDKGIRKAVIEINKFLKQYFKDIDSSKIKEIMLLKDYDEKIERIKNI